MASYYDTFRQDTLKKIKAIYNIKLDTGKKLQKLRILPSYGSLKPINIFSKYMNGIFEARITREEGSLSNTIYLWFNFQNITIKWLTQVVQTFLMQ